MKWLTLEEKLAIKLPSKFKQMLDGMLLGDATLQQECHYPCVLIEQKDEEFVKHLWEKFKELNLVNLLYRKRIKIDKRLNKDGVPYKDSVTYRFQSCSLPYFQTLMKKWYIFSGEINKRGRAKKKIKIVPLNLKLTPITLAYWIASDGSYDKVSKTLKICTNNFSAKEVLFLISLLFKKFELESRMVFAKKGQIEPMIIISRKSTEKVGQIIEKIIFRTFLYKIGKIFD